MSTPEDRISQDAMRDIEEDIAHRAAAAIAHDDAFQEVPAPAVEDDEEDEVLVHVPPRATAEAMERVIDRMVPRQAPPKPLVERITDAATSFADAVRNMSMADDAKHEKVTARDKAQTAVENADVLAHTTHVSGIAAADALVSVVNEWKVDVASRA